MLDAICRRAFFGFELPIRHIAKPPRIDGTLRDWHKSHLLPALAEIEDAEESIGNVYAAWNEAGFYVAFENEHFSGPLRCDPAKWWEGDGVRVCIDTRDARDIKRGTRHCHFFYLLPAGGGRTKKEPIVNLSGLTRAKESPPAIDVAEIQRGVHIERGYLGIELGIPASCLHGWDPIEHPRIGFFYKFQDSRRGSQTLTVSDDLGWHADPGMWATGVLVRD